MASSRRAPSRLCPYCGKAAWYGIEDRCRACNDPVARRAPNVQLANEEQAGLDRRYNEAYSAAVAAGLGTVVSELKELAESTVAVISVPIGLAFDLFKRDDHLYGPYELQARVRLRAPAEFAHDRQRQSVGSLLYGIYADGIIYGALSPDGRGLASYGSVHLTLDEITIGYRSTILSENSYQFMERHTITPRTLLPVGHLAAWSRRAQLVVAKLTERLDRNSDAAKLSKLLLDSTGDRSLDQFCEVHIYGDFNWQAVSGLSLPMPGSEDHQALDEVETIQLDFLMQRQSDFRLESSN